ncbi:hypothetical protein EWB00_005031 [Schistosoma japonicum]|uniref:Uncharacterized protein n=1 Tax=Schistosoma japonicum TaxID=6182 RepID=A0A4Z2D329_SCHJA|nr:hypothetical protein EWB00_005031 [Schistosoma japonicum]
MNTLPLKSARRKKIPVNDSCFHTDKLYIGFTRAVGVYIKPASSSKDVLQSTSLTYTPKTFIIAELPFRSPFFTEYKETNELFAGANIDELACSFIIPSRVSENGFGLWKRVKCKMDLAVA